MERVTKIDRHYTGYFRLLDYHRTHGQLLLRCSNYVGENTINVDLRFEMTEYFELSTDLEDIYLTNGNGDDWEYIKSRHNGEIYNTESRELQFLFKIISGGKVFYILAGSCVIDTNTLLPEQSSINSPR